MGATSSTAKKVTIDKKLADEYVIKHESTIQELFTTKNLVSDLQNKLKAVNVQIELVNNKLNDAEHEREKVEQELNAERKKNEIETTSVQLHYSKLERKLKRQVEKLKEDLNETNSEWNKVITFNQELKTSNRNFIDELEKVNANRSALKVELQKKENAIIKHKTTVKRLEEELYNLRRHLDRFPKEIGPDESLCKIIQIYHRIGKLQHVILMKRDDIVKKIKDNYGNEKEKFVEVLKWDYDDCVEKLESKNITLNRTNFIDIYTKYKSLSQCNNDNGKDLLKQVYHIEQSTAEFRKKFDSFSKYLDKHVGRMEISERELDMTIVVQGFITDEKLYEDVVRIAKEEIAFRRRILQVGVDSMMMNYNTGKAKNILNNGKVGNIDFQDPSTLQSAGISTPTKSKSVILFGTPDFNQSKDEDYQMISMFLAKNGIIYKSFWCRRCRKSKNGSRPLIISFTSEDAAEKIMELSKQNNWFNGFNPSVKLHIDKNYK